MCGRNGQCGIRSPHRGGQTAPIQHYYRKERPQLNEETKRLIASYRRDPSEANRSALRKQVGINYDKVLDRKRRSLKN